MATSQYGFAPPPSAPGTEHSNTQPNPPSPSSRTTQAFGALRRRVQPGPPLPTITTSLQSAPSGSFLNTQSAVTPIVPYLPYAGQAPPLTATATAAPVLPSPMASRTAQSIVAPYNPSQWSRGGPVSGAYVPYQQSPPATIRTTEITGMEAANMPSPPPPYSPSPTASPPHTMTTPMSGSALAPAPSNQSMPSQAFRELSSPMSALPASANPMSANPLSAQPWSALSPQGSVAPWDQHRMAAGVNESPRIGTPPTFQNFPPPPGRSGRDRSASRHRTDPRSLLSGISALAGRSRANEQGPQPNAIDALRMNTTNVLSRAPGQQPPQLGLNTSSLQPASQDADITSPPSARRAISTGGIGLPGPSRREPERAESPFVQPGWQPGMPLPPPPTGPPPAGNRSQSMSRASERSWSASSRESSTPAPAPPTRRPAQRGTALEPVPPTPADWVEPMPQGTSHQRSASGRLTLDTTVGGSARPVTPLLQDENVSVSSSRATDTGSSGQGSSTASANSGGGLSRQPAKRDPSARGIRERRSESRAARERAHDSRTNIESEIDALAAELDSASSTKPANLDLQMPVSRRRKSSVVTAPAIEKAHNSAMGDSSAAAQQLRHRHVGSKSFVSPGHLADTPPFSPIVEGEVSNSRRGSKGKMSPAMPPMALPTPPHRNTHDYFRPGSSTEHGTSQGDTPASASEDQSFMQGCLDRHKLFVEQEQAVKSDQERLELFADFMVRESRLRRDRYAAAFDAMAGEIFDLTRDMWRSYGSGRRSATPIATPAANADDTKLSRHTTTSSIDSHNASSVDDSPAVNTPRSDFESPMSAPGQTRGTEDAHGRSTFKPCLSPIPSMAMSTVPDEEDSRGRSQSRWWEQSLDGDSNGRGGRRIERSKRESKYMGINLEHMAQLENELPTTPHTGGTPGPSSAVPPTYYGADEYPPEKTGLHDQPYQQLTPKHPQWQHGSTPNTPDPYKLDVSRLVTLPPPFPRHHPAVNNSHPDLSGLRSTHRSLADTADIADIRSLFATKLQNLRDQHRGEATKRRESLRASIQAKIQAGQMRYTDAAAAEQDFETREPRKMRDALQAEFDAFQVDVMTPLHAILSERTTKANAAIDQLKDAIDTARKSHSSSAQEEGDERPELLEKLTLLKWLFEVRDSLLREFFNTETERNELYKALVVNPYRAAGNEEKAVEAEQFFVQDEKDRRNKFEKESLKRTENLMGIVERNVTSGVEDLLGAFWDIAPGLLAIVQKIPGDLNRECPELLIPALEFDENPSYHEHPLQYLYTLLLHAEKSAYQYIESQTNLLCLLHEAKTAVMVGGSKVMESERVQAGEELGSVTQEMNEVRRMEEGRLTNDLRDKIRTVEGQWREGLGDALGGCRQRVEQYLERTGGWDESLQE